MKNKTILIGGCSYSESQKQFNHITYHDNINWYPWTDLLDDEFGKTNTIINVARGSAGQSTITSLLMKELFEINFDVDLVLVQWSSLIRLFAEKEEDLLEEINNQGLELLSHKGIDVFTDEYLIRLKKMGFDVTFNSLIQIYLFQNLLESKNIKYKFFWGWNQNIDMKQYEFILEKIYNDNFILFNSCNKNLYGGMHDYANLILGEDNTEVDCGHPNSKAHEVFYKDIIKPILFG